MRDSRGFYRDLFSTGHSKVATIILALIFIVPILSTQSAKANFAGFETNDIVDQANTQSSEGKFSSPSLSALSLSSENQIKVDGHLNDPVWSEAASAGNFQGWDPNRGSSVSEQTVFKVAYDEDAIYFAVACLEKDPSQVAATLSRRDNFSNTDNVSIYIDPYHDKSTGYNFRVNPLGVQEDSYVYDDGDMDQDWDAVWQAETFQDEDGWYVEMRIPFSSIRYRTDISTWGLQVYRYMHARGEDTAWACWDREIAGFVSRFGSLTDIEGIPVPRQLEVMPYFVAQGTDPSMTGQEEVDDFQNFGLDLKYGITADLTLNATIQPDFGQVETDPASLNLSPFETFFREKRPFFVEGNRFFEHRGFNMFYSRRIGTGDQNSRIRYAAKLTGKTAGDISVAAMMAATDITNEGQTHNLFKNGSQSSQYMVGRFGKEFNQGNQRVNLIQTAVFRSASREDYGNSASREAYTTGLDFQSLFHDRRWKVSGSVVGSIIDPEPIPGVEDTENLKSYGTGGTVSLSKNGGSFRGSLSGRWETGDLDLNDIGFLSSPDEMSVGGWAQYSYNPNGSSKLFNRANFNINYNRSWLYESRIGFDLHTGDEVWSYKRGNRSGASSNINGWMQFRNYMSAWWGLSLNPECAQRWHTRDYVLMNDNSYQAIPGGGPLIEEPFTWGGWLGVNSDSRKSFVGDVEINYYNDEAENVSINAHSSLRWNQSSSVYHRISFGFNTRIDDTHHLENYETPGGGIGGVSYVFGDLKQKTIDLTLRSNVLFNRNQSLELYVQPYITVGDYRRARALVTPDTYDLTPFERDGFNVNDFDLSYSSVNLNAVYRWEYRPGSTLYLVWTHSRADYARRSFYDDPSDFNGNLSTGALFDNEPENKFLVKFSYWMPI